MDFIEQIRKELVHKADPKRAKSSEWFFKFEPGQSDDFLGITVPNQRAIAKKYCKSVSPDEVVGLLHSKYHEERLTALIIWVLQYQKGDSPTKKQIYDLYLANTDWVDNWDLVDSSASYIVGDYIFDKERTIVGILSKSKNIWERRIAILAAGEFIKRGEFGPTLNLAKQNLTDTHHYIHKATGWMLREVGKRNEVALCSFLDVHAHQMPRTMLRYAIERLAPELRLTYMQQKSSTIRK